MQKYNIQCLQKNASKLAVILNITIVLYTSIKCHSSDNHRPDCVNIFPSMTFGFNLMFFSPLPRNFKAVNSYKTGRHVMQVSLHAKQN